MASFRASTEKNLAKRILLDTDRKYMVQTITTVLNTYVQNPGLNCCLGVAKSVIAKYSFLKDNDGSAEVCDCVQ